MELVETERGFRSGCYIGIDGDRPSKLIDCYVHEVDPGVVSTIHRHSWDAVMICFEGRGWTEVNGVRYDYKPWDTIYLPCWAWHRQGNDGTRTAKFMTIGVEPTTATIGMSVLEDAGQTPFTHLPGSITSSPGGAGADPYARRKRRLADFQHEYRNGRIHVAYEDLTLLVNPKGTRSTFMLDAFLGSKTTASRWR